MAISRSTSARLRVFLPGYLDEEGISQDGLYQLGRIQLGVVIGDALGEDGVRRLHDVLISPGADALQAYPGHDPPREPALCFPSAQGSRRTHPLAGGCQRPACIYLSGRRRTPSPTKWRERLPERGKQIQRGKREMIACLIYGPAPFCTQPTFYSPGPFECICPMYVKNKLQVDKMHLYHRS